MTFEIRQGKVTCLHWWWVTILKKLNNMSHQTADSETACQSCCKISLSETYWLMTSGTYCYSGGKFTQGWADFELKGRKLMRIMGIGVKPPLLVHKPKVRPFFGPRVSHFLKDRTLLEAVLLLLAFLLQQVPTRLYHRDIRAAWL
jgi:hypothetical protein